MIYWVLFCVLDGIIDGFMFSKAKDYENKIVGIDVHVFMLLRRFVVILALNPSWLVIIAMALVQTFFHNGMYFETRKRMDGSYPKGFSTTKDVDDSTAFIDVDNFAIRCVLMIVGVAVYFLAL
jgi:hypothetical protein